MSWTEQKTQNTPPSLLFTLKHCCGGASFEYYWGSQPQTLQNSEICQFVTLFSLLHLQNLEWKPGPSQLPALSTKHHGCLCALVAPRLRPVPATQVPSCCPHTGEAGAAATGLVHGPVKLGDRTEEKEEGGMYVTPECLLYTASSRLLEWSAPAPREL